MLNDAVAKKRGKEIKVKTDAELNLDLEAYLPADYITDPKQRLKFINESTNLKMKISI